MDFLLDNFKHLSTTPKNVEQLKKLVLQLAVQGKLTTQWRKENPDVEPASVLLEKIKTEKEQLIKNEKIKPEKHLLPIGIDEKHFSIPENWIWCRLIEIAIISSGSTPDKKHFNDIEGVPFLKMYNLVNQNIDFHYRPQFISKIINEGQLKRSILHPGDVVMNIVGPPLGKAAIIPNDFEEWNINQALIKIRPYIKSINSFIFYFICEKSAIDRINTKGIAGQDNISTTQTRNLVLPLPPLSEQQAIVSKVESLFAQIDQLHELAKKKVALNVNTAKALFGKVNTATDAADLQETWQLLKNNFSPVTQSKEGVRQLRQTILQLAVQGKLTAKWREKNPEVESVNQLKKKIDIENEIIKTTFNLRNQKALLEITADEVPCKVPETWCWYRLGDMFYTTSGSTPSRGNTDYWDGNIPWLKSGELTDGIITADTEEKITELGHKKSSTFLFPKGTLLIALYGATAGKLGVLTYSATTNQAICGFFENENILTEYLFYFLWAYRSKILSESWGQAQPNISQDYLKKFCFALPPFAEQKAIVSRVNQLLALCDELEKKIEKRDSYQERIMQAVVKQAI